ncbi:DNA-directed RNA polymerases II and IV subunit 5A isoform X2 [Ziziphus jujuba]|uniref:DNA-directed RNA polymerases II and IV subunit 5A isoform X2 n=1 Tax=Ziziphus jujuba TaxID=326968 RepID=A0ABM3ZVP7_ZIZJJ|nr:DNA-directed RNA polymerases II and IV subunit 5A isoform X2 [Ziziphus jujuba]
MKGFNQLIRAVCLAFSVLFGHSFSRTHSVGNLVGEDGFIRRRPFKIRKTVMKMLKDRNYLVEDSEINMSKEEFKAKYGENVVREDLKFNKAKRNDSSSDQIYVLFYAEKNASMIMKTFVNCINSNNVSRAILVSQQQITRNAWKCMDLLSANCQLEVFQYQVLTDEEKKTLLERYTMKETQLPCIQVTDPIARYYGMKRGQAVKIIRHSETAGAICYL